jgi:hypothetical protein
MKVLKRPQQIEIGKLIDELGRIKARKAEAEAQEVAARDQLIAALDELGVSEADGCLFHATVSHFVVEIVSWKDIVGCLKMTPALNKLVAANTTLSERTTVKVTSR